MKFHLVVLTLLLPLLAVAGPAPSLLLAERYQDQPPFSLADYWVSEKLDGVRAYWDGYRLWSRQGNAFHPPAWFVADFPATPLDGELWMGRGTFEKVSAAVRRLQPDDREWREIRYRVFDLPASPAPFDQRVARLHALLDHSASPYVSMIAQRKVADRDALMRWLDRVVAAGGEGLMLHRGGSLYQGGRSDDLLKLKTFEDAEAVVVGYRPGHGKYRGMMGALEVKTEKGRRFALGSGFTDDQRAHPPAIGATVTFKYYGRTASGLPRFASFLRVRNDEPGR
ncbi:DNA ligase [Alcanivorax hongdengensis A-11-3]|uniref:DNA ligase n=1 Tax=Alcanivorax hongdengensis A-11-3 TaxID=1177179 RepID=L0WC44_9GAMM|nr:DNA ligase [Alcanivorax hongdengensis]EKF74516.1 DNA ligase [Alcanivorax hongdengensis A-11-3]